MFARNIKSFIAAALLALAPFAASAQDAPAAKLKVVASFSILGDFVRQIGGDRVDAAVLVGPDGDAHVYQPTPADAKKVAAAKLVVVNGLGLEGWFGRFIAAAGAHPAIATASASARVMATGGATDPHAWQDVANARTYVREIEKALEQADPAGAADYGANAAAYLAQLDALDADIRAGIAAIPPGRRRVITTHDAFGYYGRAYGMEFIAPAGVSTESEAGARDVARIIKQIRAQKIPAVFLENISDDRMMQQIARESGAKIGGKVYSDALSPSGGPAATYLDMMRGNLAEFVRALGDPGKS